MQNTPKSITCPCCGTTYDRVDESPEFTRVEKWIANHSPTYTRFNSYGFLKLYRDGTQIASTALPGMEGVEYLDTIQQQDREQFIKNL